MPSLRSAATLLLLVATSPVLGAASDTEIYRWVDANGVTVYSQTPPRSGEAVLVRPAAAPPDAERERALARMRAVVEQDRSHQEDRAAAKEKTQKDRETRATKDANCASARQNLALLEKYGQVPLRTADGKPLSLSQEELAARIQEARAQIEASCQ